MSKIKKNRLFEKTLTPPLVRVATNHFKTNGFLGDETDIASEVYYYNEDVKKSKINQDIKFTNYVSNRTDQEIKIRIQELADNPSVITSHADIVNRNTKIDQCLALYVNLVADPQLGVFKTNLQNTLGTRTMVRVFSVADLVTQDDGKLKALFRIVLIDPFHLVIPSEHQGVSKEIVEQRTFNDNRSNTICMSEWMGSWFN
ncbi:hypothetical protein [Paenibacillus sinopodophylli]|uniref:hypothetical protein n=1 Tax=Paenibacillus sinopodophylli TaxID=1837342 RepID=UPI00110CE052|nr:hypothetical protein [Paenibacillus sinopodophylli]